jgi:hypothetical protein
MKIETRQASLLGESLFLSAHSDDEQADLLESTIEREYVRTSATAAIHVILVLTRPTLLSYRCNELRTKMTQLSEGEYAAAKNDVDRLRQELGQPPLPSLQSTLDEKASQ